MHKDRRLISDSPVSKLSNQENYEFTPIGASSSHPKTTNKSSGASGIGPTRLTFNSNTKNNSYKKQSSSFIDDSQYDVLDNADNVPQHPLVREHTKQRTVNILNEASNPVLQQQESFSRLQTENYNLRVNLAGLQKMVDSMASKEQIELYNENSRLQKENINLNSELKLSKQELLQERAKIRNQMISHEKNLENETLKSKLKSLTEQLETLKHADEKNIFLRRTNQQLSDKNKTLLSESDNSNNQLDEAQNKIHRLGEELRNAKGQVEDLEYELHSITNLLEEQKHELNEKDEEVEEKIKIIEDLRNRLDKYQTRSSENEQSINGQVEELKTLLIKRDEEIHDLKRHKEKLNQYKSQLERVTKDLQSSVKLESRSRTDLELATKKIKLLEDERLHQDFRNPSDDAISQLKRDMIELEAESYHLRNDLEQISKANKDYEKSLDEFDGFDAFVEKLKTENSTLRNHVKHLNQLHDEVVDKCTELNSQINQEQKEHKQLNSEYEKLYYAYQELKKQQQEQQQRKDLVSEHDIEDELNNWKIEVDRLSSELEDLSVRNNALKRGLDKEKTINLNRSRYDDEEFNQLIDRYRQLQSEYQELQDYMETLKTSSKEKLKFQTSVISEKDTEIRKLKLALRQSEVSANDMEEKFFESRQDLQRKIKSLQLKLDDFHSIRDAEVKTLKSVVDSVSDAKGISSISGCYEQLERKFKQYRDELTRIIKEKSIEIVDLTEALTKSDTKISQLDQDKGLLESQIKSLEMEVTSLKSKISENNDQVKDTEQLNKFVKELQEKLKAKLTEIERLKTDKDRLTKSLNEVIEHLKSNGKDASDGQPKMVVEGLKMSEELSTAQNELAETKGGLTSVSKCYEELLTKYNQLVANKPLEKENELLKCKLAISKIVMIDKKYTIIDLNSMYTFTKQFLDSKMVEIEDRNRQLRSLGVDLRTGGNALKKTLTWKFKVVARHVVAALRMRNKALYAKPRADRLKELVIKLQELEC